MSNAPRTDVPVMAELYTVHGWTLEEIGTHHGISRERVRQLLRRAGVPVRKSLQKGWASLDPVQAMAALRAPGVEHFADAARGLGVSAGAVSDFVRETGCRAALVRLYRLRRRRRRLLALRTLAEQLGRTPTAADINDSELTPTHITYILTFGSVGRACRAAGLTPRRRGVTLARELA